jgi:hypothetical protein
MATSQSARREVCSAVGNQFSWLTFSGGAYRPPLPAMVRFLSLAPLRSLKPSLRIPTPIRGLTHHSAWPFSHGYPRNNKASKENFLICR